MKILSLIACTLALGLSVLLLNASDIMEQTTSAIQTGTAAVKKGGAVVQEGLQTASNVAQAGTLLVTQATATIDQITLAVNEMKQLVNAMIAAGNSMTAQKTPSNILNKSFDVTDLALTAPAAMGAVIDQLVILVGMINTIIITPINNQTAAKLDNALQNIENVKMQILGVTEKLKVLNPKLRASTMGIEGEVGNMINAVKNVKI
jgi:hypothetical protein